ncbi:hypothetical protein PCLA_07f0262 [Pseudomonas citronellolis]|nr:hypothetical protein PCLA_07f0262 [Pseudomonas citronellolis]
MHRGRCGLQDSTRSGRRASMPGVAGRGDGGSRPCCEVRP